MKIERIQKKKIV